MTIRIAVRNRWNSAELAQRHSIGNAFTQLAVVPVLDTLENERAQDLLRRQSASTALRLFQSSRQIAPHLLDNLLLIVKKIGNGLQLRLQAHALAHQFPLGKTDLPCRRSRHPSALSCTSGFVLLTLQGLDVTGSGLKQQLLQCTTLLQTVLDFRHEVLGDVNGKTAPLRLAVQDPTRVLFTGLAWLTVRTDARSAAQAERAENCKSSGRLALEPAPDISR
jgi:hypothetical protein